MARYVDLVDVFGEANVVRAAPGELEKLGLPPDAVRTLTEVGLPRQIGRAKFIAVPPDFVPAEVVEAAGLAGRFCQFGLDAGTHLCIDLDNGQVWSLPKLGAPFPAAFVNSTLGQFVECQIRLYILESSEPPGYREDHDVNRAFAEFVAAQMRAIDDLALDHPRSVWPEILEEIEFPF